MGRAQDDPRRDGIALCKVVAARPDVAAPGSGHNADHVAVAVYVLLQFDMVKALRHRCAGEDADGGARAGSATPRMACRAGADHGQGVVQIDRPHRIAVHRGCVKGWLGQPGHGGLQQGAAMGVGQGHNLGARRVGKRQNAFKGLGDRDHRGAS